MLSRLIDIVNRPPLRDAVGGYGLVFARPLERRRDDGAPRNDHFFAALREQLLGERDAIGFHERRADLEPHRSEERARHRAADEELIHAREQRPDDVDFSRDLRAAEHRDERTFGIRQQLAEVFELLFHQEAGDRWLEQMRDRFGGRMRPVRRAERVVDVEIAQRGKRLGKLRIVFLLARPEARVLDEGDGAAWQASCGRDAAHRIGNEFDGRAEQPFQVADDLLEGVLRIRATFRPAQMREQHDARSLFPQVRDRRQRGAEPRVVGDLAVLQRDVEVDPHERALAVQRLRRKVPQAAFVQRRLPM